MAEGEGKMADEPRAWELYLYIKKDGQLYRQMTQSIIHNYAIKKIKGTYDPQKAIKGWVNLVEEGLARYKKEYRGYEVVRTVDMGTKILAAKHLADAYAEELANKVKQLRALKATGKVWQRRI